jgi:hypothetical protein
MLQVYQYIGNNYKRKRMYVYRGLYIIKFSSIILLFFSAHHWLFVRACCSLVFALMCSSFNMAIHDISYKIPYA